MHVEMRHAMSLQSAFCHFAAEYYTMYVINQHYARFTAIRSLQVAQDT